VRLNVQCFPSYRDIFWCYRAKEAKAATLTDISSSSDSNVSVPKQKELGPRQINLPARYRDGENQPAKKKWVLDLPAPNPEGESDSDESTPGYLEGTQEVAQHELTANNHKVKSLVSNTCRTQRYLVGYVVQMDRKVSWLLIRIHKYVSKFNVVLCLFIQFWSARLSEKY